MAVAEIREKNNKNNKKKQKKPKKIDMTGSRTRCIPLRNREIDAAHVHGPVLKLPSPVVSCHFSLDIPDSYVNIVREYKNGKNFVTETITFSEWNGRKMINGWRMTTVLIHLIIIMLLKNASYYIT